ncbi:hypothetical protein CRENBAI_010611 [Crenichthys baileyi]|uniref:Uncharacterized protein n=1 Tax=Crenichthys baileyi TaxID=28760 RepID=A0AAV9QTE6_9TELE
MENDHVPCFTVCPWHGLAVGDVVVYVQRNLHVDDVNLWSDMDKGGELRAFKMEDVASVELDAGLSVVFVRLLDPQDVSYHCIGCKNFYRVLFANNVSGDTLIQRVYDHTQILTLSMAFVQIQYMICHTVSKDFEECDISGGPVRAHDKERDERSVCNRQHAPRGIQMT